MNRVLGANERDADTQARNRGRLRLTVTAARWACSVPAVLIIVGEEDILLRDNLAMAAALSAAGVDVDLRIYPAAPHGFTGHATPMANAALDDLHAWLDSQLGQ